MFLRGTNRSELREFAGQRLDDTFTHWKRNLLFIWCSQFFAIMGFSFAMPFAPLFIQELGVTGERELSLWVALFSGATPLTMAVFSPVWGALADRFGRRMMLMRSYVGGIIVLVLMSRVRTVEMLVVLRLAQGVMTGTMVAAQTLVSTQTPPERGGTALGALSAAVFSGSMVGSFVGGMFAELYGFRAAFMLSSSFMAASFIFTLFGVTEHFVPRRGAARGQGGGLARLKEQWGAVVPLLVMALLLSFVAHFEKPWIPLLVQEIHGAVKGASAWSGSLFAACGIAGFIAGPTLGAISDRIPPRRLVFLCCLGSGAMLMPVAFVSGFPSLFLCKFAAAFFAGGIDPMLQIWLSRVTPFSCRGLVFGWSSTARSLGWLTAPLISGAISAAIGVRGVFAMAAVMFVAVAPVVLIVTGRRQVAACRPPVIPPPEGQGQSQE